MNNGGKKLIPALYYRVTALVLLVTLCASMCCGCNRLFKTNKEGYLFVEEKDSLTIGFYAFDTYMNITVCRDSNGKLISRASLARTAKEAKRLENVFAITLADAEINKINEKSLEAWETAGGGALASFITFYKVSPEITDILTLGARVNAETGGAFDLTAYPFVNAWGFKKAEYRIPESGELEELSSRVGMDKISIVGEDIVLDAGTQLDFGAIAKGYLCDALVEYLKNEGVERALLDLGGNVATIGTKEDGSCWKVGIRDPLDSKRVMGYIQVGDANIATSGGYDRYFTDEDGDVYWHILNPSTGYPAHSGVISATIIGAEGTGALCDALSTAFFVMGQEKVEIYSENHADIEYILVLEDGTVVVSEGLKERYEANE